MAASDGDTQRIHDAAEKLLAADAELRSLSWTKVQDIANALSVKKLRGSERRAYARELQVIAATNLAVAARLDGSDDREAMRAVIKETPAQEREAPSDERTVESRVSSDSDAQRSLQTDAGEPAPTDQSAEPDRSIAADQPSDANVQDDQNEAPAQGTKNEIPANPNFDEKGRWTGDTAPMNVVQMINAEMVFQSENEGDKDRYAAAAAQASLYDDPVSVVLPSAEELESILPTVSEMASVEDEELKREVVAEHRERDRARLSDTERTPVVKPGEPGQPGAGGTRPADPKPAEGEPSISFGVSEHSRTERAVLAEKERKEAKKARKRAKRAERKMRWKNGSEHSDDREGSALSSADAHSASPTVDDERESASRNDRIVTSPAGESSARGQASVVQAPAVSEPGYPHTSDETAPGTREAHDRATVTHEPLGTKNSASPLTEAIPSVTASSHESPTERSSTDVSEDKETEHESGNRKQHRFKLFGRRNAEDLPVIPRGKSTYAPDDLFVIDKHRAAQARAQQESAATDSASSAVREDPASADSNRHRPEHARSSTEEGSTASADESAR